MLRNVTTYPLTAFDLLFRNFLNTQSDFFDVQSASKIPYPVDIVETTDGLLIQIACIEAEEKDIDISTSMGVLRIRYSRPESEPSNYIRHLVQNIARRTFDIGYKVSGKYDLDRVNASLSKGLLTIVIPLSGESTAKKIPVNGKKGLYEGA